MDEYNDQIVEVNVEPVGAVDQPQKKGFAIAALVLGITSIVPGACCYFVGLGAILGILAIIFAILFLKANKNVPVSKAMAITGLVLGGVGVLVFAITLIAVLAFMSSGGYDEFYNEFINGIQEAQ